MGSLEQVNGESNPMAAFDVKKETPTNNTLEGFDLENQKQQKPAWRTFFSYVGPGFLVSMAYIDPGNLETDLQAGANNGFELLWVILLGMIFALIIQSLAANLGVSTGKHLSELCKAEYPIFVKYCLWLLAEAAVIAADIPEVIGTAFGLNILFHIPVWAGVLLTGLSTLLLIGLQRYGIRKLELFVAIMVFIMASCFFGEMAFVKPPAADLFKGLFIPKLSGQTATGDAIALIGALIMPHNLFLHSALVLSRKIPNSVRGIKEVCRFYLMETGFALFVALLINIAVTSVSATVCSDPSLSSQCNNVTLNSASFLLQNVLKKSSSTIYGIALLASGQSSSITCTYAGQFIMQGFLDLKMKRWQRNLMTRTISIAPSLIASLVGGPAAAGNLIIISSMILSFELPFSLIPLLKFSSSTSKMGPYKSSIYIIVISWIMGLAIIGANIYYLSTSFVGWMIHSTLPKAATIFIAIIVFPMMVIYVASVIYLMWRKDTAVTYIDTTKNDPTVHSSTEDGEDSSVPYREDLADIPLPE
ncbi:metal transporter Nramp7.2-like [Rhododendron vialii]|uniref:metal transporter Nramp7.2-like n=1 Tax=Rhododendron vialii TaxID=182163 RepID=UPI00265F4F1D|nr:metal transporter Nramp7.2-like [Rhododendron vialii]